MKASYLASIILAAFTSTLVAGTSPQVSPDSWPLERGTFSLEIMGGAYDSFGGRRIGYTLSDTQLRLGYMLNTPTSTRWWGGNYELLAAVGGGAVFDGPGDGYGTFIVHLRYNFARRGARLIPYVQTGLGFFVSDIARSRAQADIGRTVEFDIQDEAGLRYLLSSHWSLQAEVSYRHVSNAGTADRNVGINAVGALLGLSRSF